MASSDAVKAIINQAYKQNRQEDDLNQPRSVQSWGSDGDKRRYFLVEGQDDTNFRIYRESNPAGTNRTWFSVAGSIEELKALSEKLETKDGGPKAKKLSQKMLQVIPRFEAGEEVRPYNMNTYHPDRYNPHASAQFGGSGFKIACANMSRRNASAANIVKCEKNSSNDQSLDSQCMKVVHGANGSSTRTRTTKMPSIPTLQATGDLPAIPEPTRLPRQGQSRPPVADRSGHHHGSTWWQARVVLAVFKAIIPKWNTTIH